MKLLPFSLVAFVLAAIVGQPAAVQAQEPTRTLRLHLGASAAPPVVPPAPSPEVLEKDVDEATAIIKGREKAEQVAREAARAFERRPDLNHDVVQGIQALGIQDALRRR